MAKPAQLRITDVYDESQEIHVECTACDEDFIWSTINRAPDYCPMCGKEIDCKPYTNPERIEK